MLSELFQLFLGALRLNVVHLCFGLLQIVFHQLQELDARAIGSATDSFLRRQQSEFLLEPPFLHKHERVDIGGRHAHLICDVSIL